MKKRSKSGGSVGTSSGCSSSHSPPLSNDEEPEWHQPISTQQYMLDPRSVSQLTSARVPFEITDVPNNTINDSLRVHCGATILKDPCPSGVYSTFPYSYIPLQIKLLNLLFNTIPLTSILLSVLVTSCKRRGQLLTYYRSSMRYIIVYIIL